CSVGGFSVWGGGVGATGAGFARLGNPTCGACAICGTATGGSFFGVTTYKITPAAMRRQAPTPAPARMRPVFRDAAFLGGIFLVGRAGRFPVAFAGASSTSSSLGWATGFFAAGMLRRAWHPGHFTFVPRLSSETANGL